MSGGVVYQCRPTLNSRNEPERFTCTRLGANCDVWHQQKSGHLKQWTQCCPQRGFDGFGGLTRQFLRNKQKYFNVPICA